MTVDLRVVVACDLGHLISGDVGSNHISDRSGLVMTSGRLTIEGLLSPARGTAVNLLVACPQLNRVTRFPKVLRVIRATSYPLDNRTEVEVGCMLTLMKERKDKATYFASGSNPLSAQALLTHCLAAIGVTLTPGTRSLTRSYLLSQVDLSQGYVQIIGDLIRSENCVGRLRPDDTLEIIDISLSQGRPGPVLTKDDLVSIEPIGGGQDPPDQFTVTYNAVERQPGDSSTPVLPDSYWTTSTTYSEPDYVFIRYTTVEGEDRSIAYLNAASTVSESRYKTIEYKDADGKTQKQDVVVYKIDTKSCAVGAVNSGFMSSVLRYDLRPVNFSANTSSTNETWYEYTVTKDGPVLSKETTEQRVSEMEFAGGMSVPDYVTILQDGFPFVYYIPYYATPGILTTRTVVKYETITVPVAGGLERTKTRTETSRWLSRGLTQEGQQEFQWALKDRANNNIVPGLVSQYSFLRYEGTEVSTSEGKPAVPSRPLPQEATAAAIGGQSTSSKTATGTVLYSAGQSPIDAITTTATYDMPYCPDDISTPGTAQAAALAFGQSEAALDVGHAFGYNIVTSFDRLPTLELSTVYVRLAGIEVAFLTDSLSYAFDASGMVVSSDLMLLGVSGYYGATAPATSWIRLASSPSALPQAPTPSASVAMKANSISYPVGGVDPRNPGAVFALLGNTGTDAFGTYQGTPQLVGPTLELDAFALAAGPTVDVVEFNYALDTGTDVVDLATGPVVEFAWVTTITSPAATIALAPFAPAISTGARVAVPVAALQVEAAAPAVASGAAVTVPAAAVVVAGAAPDLVGRQKTIVSVPAATIELAATAPAIRRGAGVLVPAANIALAASVPVIQTGAVDPNYANVSLLLHMDGSNDSTTFTDSGPNALTVEVVGGAKITTANKKYGTGALTTAVSGGYLRIASNNVFNMGTSPFTIEFFTYCSDQSNVYAALIGNASSWGTNACSIRFDDTNGPQRFLVACNTSTGGTTLFSTSSTYTFNQWRHVAVVRNGTSMQIYVDGQLAGSATISASAQFDWSAGGYFYVCYSFDGANSNSREITDEIRVTKGIARYTSAFTPPAAAFANQ